MLLFFLLARIVPAIFTNQWIIVYISEAWYYFLYTVLFSFCLKKYKLTPLYLCLAFLYITGWGLLLSYIRQAIPNNVPFQIAAKISVFSNSLLICYLCYDSKRYTAPLFCWMSAIAIFEIVSCCSSLLTFALGQNPRTYFLQICENTYVNALLYDLERIIPPVFIILFCRKNFLVRRNRTLNKKTIILLFLSLASLIFIKTFTYIFSNTSKSLYICCVIQELLIALLLLFLRSDIVIESSYKMQIDIMNQVLASQENQYESMKANIEVINMKAHDIRHQLEKYQESLMSDAVKEINNTVKSYDFHIKTGNAVMDTILYSANLRFEKEHIRLTSLVNGKLLDFIPSSELYYLFSNIIDNAYEAVKELPQEKKIISLVVHKDNNSILIEESNYFQGERILTDGMYQSTKKSKAGHGYGLKSIRFITEKNKGTINLKTKEDMFFLTITFPVSANMNS